MRLGAYLVRTVSDAGGTVRGASASDIAAQARLLEELGYSSCWVGDTMARTAVIRDPLADLTVAAAASSDLHLYTGILQVPLRDPRELALRMIALQDASGGRAHFGVGSGSTARDFALFGADFGGRFGLFARNLAEIERTAAELGRLGDLDVLIGSWGSGRWLISAAEKYAGWVSSASLEHPERSFSASSARQRWSDLAASIELFRAAGGRRAILANLKLTVADPAGGRVPEVYAAGAGEPLAATFDRVLALGFEEVVVRAPGNTMETFTRVRDAWVSATSG